MASNIRVRIDPPTIAVPADFDHHSVIDEPYARRPLDLFEEARSSESAWELAPDGIALLGGDRSPDPRPSHQVSVRRRPARLEVVKDGAGRTLPRIRSSCRTVELHDDGLRIDGARPGGFVPWGTVRVSVTTMDFVEREPVAVDATTVGTVEQPTRRWRRRREVPVVRYGSVRVTAADARAAWVLSSIEAAHSLGEALTALGARRI